MAGSSFDDQGRVEIDDVVLEAPGLEGEVRVERPDPDGRVRGSKARTDLDEAMQRVEMRTDREVVIERPRHVGPGGAGTRGARATAPVMRLTVPAPPRGEEQAVLSIDEHGVATWRIAGRRGAADGSRGGKRTRTYELPRTAAAPRGAGRTRGLIPGLDKVIRIITFPIASAVAGGARFAVREWDQQRHPPRVRRYLPTGALEDLADGGWDRLSEGPALLFVHGTFSTTEGGFGRLKRETRDALEQRYGGRVIAYDHPTIADDPIVNARRFFEIAGDRRLTLDVVCHSRGGLVSRAIAERPGDLRDVAPQVSVRNLVLVGVPNAGTILADAEHWDELLDRFTTLLNLFPGPGVPEALETVLAVVRSIAVKTAQNLEGLDAMVPTGAFLSRLNVAADGDTSYRALVSDFEPKNPGLRAWLRDALRDQLFERRPNDMMVTVDSMAGENGSSRFPVREIRGFKPADAIEHSGYFPQAATGEALLEWLPG